MTGRHCRRIGLTGGIGAGKSTASAHLRALGAYIIDADEIARRTLEPDGACYGSVLAVFGEGILGADGKIDRKALSAIVFSDRKKLESLNSIVHPHVMSEMFAKADAAQDRADGLIFFEVPLLFESGIDRRMDRNILITSCEETRVNRITNRDGCTREEALARIRAQMPEKAKIKRADYVLTNNGAKQDLERRVERLYADLTDTHHAQNGKA
jgi:dephospho-CoA kinase